MREEMKREIDKVKERDNCEECTWNSCKLTMCDSCRLFEGNSYFLPNLFNKVTK